MAKVLSDWPIRVWRKSTGPGLVSLIKSAAVSVTGEPKASGPDAAERGKKLAERLPRERALAAHTLLVAKSRFEDILKKRAELLEKKAAGK